MNETTAEWIRAAIRSSVQVKEDLYDSIPQIHEIAFRLIEAYQNHNKVLVFGNGGSAADAQHLVAELVGRFAFDRPSLPAIALTVDTSCLTAIANDYSFNNVFARQIEGLGLPGDVAIGISTSGNSGNVVEGIRTARKWGLVTIGVTGGDGGALAEVADYCLKVPSSETPRIQEAHILLAHIWCQLVESALFGSNQKNAA